MNKKELEVAVMLGVLGGVAAAIVYPLADSVGKKIAEYNPKDSELKDNVKMLIGSFANVSITAAAAGGTTGALWAIADKMSK